ncbi:MAG: flavin reductase [Bacteroidales bacterium]|nr:flavin reductase [Bacteroidales bacterium]
MKDALYNIEYGLFVLTAHENGKDNGCIINAVTQVTSSEPIILAVNVSKKNYTHGMIQRTGLMNISILTKDVPMDVIKHFGFQSGENVNKFENCTHAMRSENGLLYVPKYTNAVISGKVVSSVDCSDHTIFLVEVTEKKVLSDAESVTYSYYRNTIMPSAKKAAEPKTEQSNSKWICKVCGYVYEGEELPADYICPWCKHGVSDFEKLD